MAARPVEKRISLREHLLLGEENKDDRTPKEVRAKRHIHGNFVVNNSFLRFWTQVAPFIRIPQRIKPFTLRQCKYIRIQAFWVYSPDKNIMGFSVEEIAALMQGLHWNVFGDRYFVNRTSEWLKEVKLVFEMCMFRILQLVLSKKPFDSTIMNHHSYCSTVLMPGTKIEKRIINWTFLYDMEALMTTMLLAMMKERNFTPKHEKINTSWLVEQVFDRLCNNKPETIVNYRQNYVDTLSVNEAYKMIQRRKQPLNMKPASRSIIVYMHDALYHEACPNVESVFRITGSSRIIEQVTESLSADAMFTFYCAGYNKKTGDPLRVLKEGEPESLPKLVFAPIQNIWVLTLEGEVREDGTPAHTRIGFDTVLEAFIYLRTRHSHITEKDDISLSPFPVEEEE